MTDEAREPRRDVTICFNDGKPTFSPAGPYHEWAGDTIALSLESGKGGFPDESYISRIDFYSARPYVGNTKVVDKTSLIGSVTNSYLVETQTVMITTEIDGVEKDIYSVNMGVYVYIADVEGNSLAADHYWFSATVSNLDGRTWDADPEIVNEGSGGGG